MPSRPKGHAEYGKAVPITVTAKDVLGATPESGRPRDLFKEHPLFNRVGKGTLERFREDIKRVGLNNGERLTKHSAEPGRSPINRVYFPDVGAEHLDVRLYALSDDPETAPGEDLGKVQLNSLGLRSWFGGSTHIRTEPGLVVTSTRAQKARVLPSLSQYFNPDNPDDVNGILPADVMQMLRNTGEIFSGLMSEDNRTEIAQMPGFRPHSVPGISDRELGVLTKLPGVQTRALAQHSFFTPDQDRGLQDSHAMIISGRGWFFDREAVEGRSMNAQDLIRSGVAPIAQIGSNDDSRPANAFAFQWAGLNPQRNKAQAVFVPSIPGVTLHTFPIGTNLELLHRSVDSIAATAASMHTHVAAEGARLEAEKPAIERALGALRKRFGGLFS